MPDSQNTIIKLLYSKSKTANYLGIAILLTLFAPAVFRAVGDANLTIWQRLEQVTVAAGQTLLTIGVVAINPQDLIESKPVNAPEETTKENL